MKILHCEDIHSQTYFLNMKHAEWGKKKNESEDKNENRN